MVTVPVAWFLIVLYYSGNSRYLTKKNDPGCVAFNPIRKPAGVIKPGFSGDCPKKHDILRLFGFTSTYSIKIRSATQFVPIQYFFLRCKNCPGTTISCRFFANSCYQAGKTG